MLLAHPLSRGCVHVASPATSPFHTNIALDPKYLSHPADVETLARVIRFADSLSSTTPLAAQVKSTALQSEKSPGDLDVARRYAKESVIGAAHYTGTCSMMPREYGGVVDSQLKVHGAERLRVCDASIIPIIPRANTQAAVYGVAEHAAIMIWRGDEDRDKK